MKALRVSLGYVFLVLVFVILGATVSLGVSNVSAQIQSQYPVGALHWNGRADAGQDSTNFQCDPPYTMKTFTYNDGTRSNAIWHECQ